MNSCRFDRGYYPYSDIGRRQRGPLGHIRDRLIHISPYFFENYGLYLLATEVLHFGVEKVPHATALLMILQTLTYTQHVNGPRASDVCISAAKVIESRDWKSFVMSNFVHGSDMHLAYNMISLLLKGAFLEPVYSLTNFAVLIGALTAMCSTMYVALGLVLAEIFNESYYTDCAVGFSSVLFALKVICVCEQGDSPQYIEGFPVPSKWAVWIELVFIHILVPRASLIGHLAGICIGYLYCNTNLGEMIEDKLKKLTGQRIVHKSAYNRRRVYRIF